jgi:hypothetical protein
MPSKPTRRKHHISKIRKEDRKQEIGSKESREPGVRLQKKRGKFFLVVAFVSILHSFLTPVPFFTESLSPISTLPLPPPLRTSFGVIFEP